MLFHQIVDSESCSYTYPLSPYSGYEALLIDPVKRDTRRYLDLLNEFELELAVASIRTCTPTMCAGRSSRGHELYYDEEFPLVGQCKMSNYYDYARGCN
jgi:hypothetical protein